MYYSPLFQHQIQAFLRFQFFLIQKGRVSFWWSLINDPGAANRLASLKNPGYLLSEKQRQLIEWVNVRGRIRLDELARLLAVSVETTAEWIYQLVQRGQFNGYVNWGQRLVYASTAQKIGSESLCPQCGGQLSPAPGNCIVCLHCGTEAWVTTQPGAELS